MRTQVLLSAAVSLAITLSWLASCAAVQKGINTADDLAHAACELFGEERPAELAQYALAHLPASTAQELEREPDALVPEVLCTLDVVLDWFRSDQRAAVARMYPPAGNTSGGECAPPGGGPGTGAESP